MRFLPTLLLLAISATTLQAQSLELKPGDRISIVGNTLGDRMQHDGWLDTLLAARFPKHDLSVRYLAFPGDEVTTRLRSANFGSPDDWLKKTKTSVILAFFGYNESFKDEAGLEQFKKDLDNYLKQITSQPYDSVAPPRVVLFSPIPQEAAKGRHLPDPKETNRRLALYSKAMAEVAKDRQVVFVDLLTPMGKLYATENTPLTINGIHLTSEGNRLLAGIIDAALFKAALKTPAVQLEKIRQAVLDRNFHWFHRYRTVDGYSVYGGRAGLKFVEGQTNKVVMDREMEILDAMTANRDKAVNAAAQGLSFKVDDSNTPNFLEVRTNKPGAGEGGKHLFLDPDEAIKKMTLGKGLRANLFASERDWPELVAPVQMSFDTKGRLWVAVWPTYPHWKPKEPMNDKILIFEDTNGDGKADKMTVFADKLHCPTGFEFWNGGVIVAQQPDILFLKDTNGDDKADVNVRILHGIDSADTHHAANSFVLDGGGALYFQEGTFHQTQIETPYGPPVRNSNAGVFRYEPRTQKIETYVNFGFANPHGHVFDRWGQDIVVDGTGAVPYHAALFSGQVDYPNRHGRPPTVYKQKTRPCPGMEILSSRHFPESWQGNLLVGNVIGFQGILRYQIKDKGASLQGIEQEPIVSSSDPNFRPSDLRVGPDGAIYFIDWHNPIIGHMQHNLRDPSRDHMHGRIYRITYENENRPLSKPAIIAGQPIEKLLDLLKEPEDRVRYRTRIELGGRPSEQVLAAASKWIDGLDRNDPEYEHHRLEGLWLFQNHDAVNLPLLKAVLQSPDFRARAAATRVLCYQRDRVPEVLDLLRQQINDSSPRVRLEAIRALSFFRGEEAMSIALELLAHPDDEYLRFVFNETLNTLEKRIDGGKLDRKNIAGSLIALLDRPNVTPQRQATLLETISRHGGPKELAIVFERAMKLTPAQQAKVFDALTEAAQTRRVKPPVKAAQMQSVLAAAKGEALIEALELVGAWKMTELSKDLRDLAQIQKTPMPVRLAALDAMAALGDPESHQDLVILTGPEHGMAIRYRASSALAKLNLGQGAGGAADAIADTKANDDPSEMIEAFLAIKDGPKTLADRLQKRKVSPDAAKLVLRAMFMAGRNDAPLADVASKIAGLDADAKPPTPQEIAQIAQEVVKAGDAAQGERIFRRADLGCLKCHALYKAGGNIGPDLGPVGAASPLEYLVQAVLDPSASIKEEYLAKVFVTGSGQVVTGIVQSRDANQVLLKDATGKKIRLAAADIEEEANGKSLMPEGVTRLLTRTEVIHLVKYLSELGKPGPYGAPKATTIQRWKTLKNVQTALAEGVPNRELVREHLLAAEGAAWDFAFPLAGGQLSLADLKKGGKFAYLQAEVQVNDAGPLELKFDAPSGSVLWLDEEAIEKTGTVPVNWTPGRHRITVRAPIVDGNLRVELIRPGDSKARFEIVQGGD